MRNRLLLPLVGVMIAAASASAHHSFAAEFDEKAPVKLTGTVTKLELVNPHMWVYIDVKNPDGTVTNWGIEGGAPNAILRRGLRREDFPIGTQVTVDGYRAKNGSTTANGRTVTFLDGRNFFLGSSGGPKDGAEK
jgi:uncharacterized protein DUF6152